MTTLQGGGAETRYAGFATQFEHVSNEAHMYKYKPLEQQQQQCPNYVLVKMDGGHLQAKYISHT